MKINAIKDALRDRFGMTTCPLCKTGNFEVRPRAVTIIDKLPSKQAASSGAGKTGESSLTGQDLVYTSCSSCGYVLLFDPQKLSVNISEAESDTP